MNLTIVVKKHGNEEARLELSPGQEYIFGRSASCAIVLDNEKGISRQHFKIFYENDQWNIELLSKYGELIVNGESTKQVTIDVNSHVIVSPYEFEFSAAEQASAESHEEVEFTKEDFADISFDQEEQPSPVSSTQSISQEPEFTAANFGEDDNDDTDSAIELDGATQVSRPEIVPYLKVKTGPDDPEELFRLEGQAWLAGRDSNCEVYINHPHISRRHFEITRTPTGFTITDLNSSNGTTVNGQKIPPKTPTNIESGDSITIKSVEIAFEVRNMQFEQLLDQAQKMPVPTADRNLTVGKGGGAQIMQTPVESEGWPTGKDKARSFIAKNKIRLAIAALLLIAIVFGMDDEPQQDPGQRTSSSSASGKAELTEEQKKQLRDFLILAQEHLDRRRFALCIAQVEKIHQIVPVYANSKELEKLCRQGESILEEERARARQERERKRLQEWVQREIERCEAQINESTTLEEIDSCLAEVRLRDPENAEISRLRGIVEQRMAAEQQRLQRAKARARKKNNGFAKFRSCSQNFNSKKYSKAIEECREYINRVSRGTYIQQGNRPNRARKFLSQAKKQLSSYVAKLINQCESEYGKKEYKKAIIACKKAEVLASSGQQKNKANTIKRDVAATLNKEMKSMYQDATVEENFGNIESAKLKYKEILKRDIPGGKYYKKAKSKLKKYGEVF